MRMRSGLMLIALSASVASFAGVGDVLKGQLPTIPGVPGKGQDPSAPAAPQKGAASPGPKATPLATVDLPAAAAPVELATVGGPLSLYLPTDLGASDCKGAVTAPVVLKAAAKVEGLTLHSTGSALYVQRPDGRFMCLNAEVPARGVEVDLSGPAGEWVIYSGSRNFASASSETFQWTLRVGPAGTEFLPTAVATGPAIAERNPALMGPFTLPMLTHTKDFLVSTDVCKGPLSGPVVLEAAQPLTDLTIATTTSTLYVETPDGKFYCANGSGAAVRVAGSAGKYHVWSGDQYGSVGSNVTWSLRITDPTRPREAPFDVSQLPVVTIRPRATESTVVGAVIARGDQRACNSMHLGAEPIAVLDVQEALSSTDINLKSYPYTDEFAFRGPLTANYDDSKWICGSPATTLPPGKYALFAGIDEGRMVAAIQVGTSTLPALKGAPTLQGEPPSGMSVADRDALRWYPALWNGNPVLSSASARFAFLQSVPKTLWVQTSRDLTAADLRPLGVSEFADNGKYVSTRSEPITPAFPKKGEPVVWATHDHHGILLIAADGAVYDAARSLAPTILAPLGDGLVFPEAPRNTRLTLEGLAADADPSSLKPFQAFDSSFGARNECISRVGGAFGAATEGVLITAEQRAAASDKASAGYASCPKLVGDEAVIRADLQARRDAQFAMGLAAVRRQLEPTP